MIRCGQRTTVPIHECLSETYPLYRLKGAITLIIVPLRACSFLRISDHNNRISHYHPAYSLKNFICRIPLLIVIIHVDCTTTCYSRYITGDSCPVSYCTNQLIHLLPHHITYIHHPIHIHINNLSTLLLLLYYHIPLSYLTLSITVHSITLMILHSHLSCNTTLPIHLYTIPSIPFNPSYITSQRLI